MTVAIEPPAAAVCPPHYWLIEKAGLHTQHWSCQRCGAEKDLQDSLKLRNRWVSQGSNPRTTTPSTPSAALVALDPVS